MSLQKLIDGEDNTTEYHYDRSLLSSIHYPTYQEHLTYDSRDRLKDSTQQANNQDYLRRYGYDLGGNLNNSTDANQNLEAYTYDALNRLTLVTDANGGITEFSYDDRDNLLQVKDPQARLTGPTIIFPIIFPILSSIRHSIIPVLC